MAASEWLLLLLSLLPLFLAVVFALPAFMALPSHGSPWIFFWRSLFSPRRLLGEANPTPSSRNSQLEYPRPPHFCSSYTQDWDQPNRALLDVSYSVQESEIGTHFLPRGVYTWS